MNDNYKKQEVDSRVHVCKAMVNDVGLSYLNLIYSSHRRTFPWGAGCYRTLTDGQHSSSATWQSDGGEGEAPVPNLLILCSITDLLFDPGCVT